jgi:hypothetical protein
VVLAHRLVLDLASLKHPNERGATDAKEIRRLLGGELSVVREDGDTLAGPQRGDDGCREVRDIAGEFAAKWSSSLEAVSVAPASAVRVRTTRVPTTRA